MVLVPLYTAQQVIGLGVASTHAAVRALIAAGDLHPVGTGHACLPAAEVLRLAELPALDLDQPAVLVRLGPWAPEDGTVLAGRAGGGYRADLTAEELAASSRGVWRVTPARFFRAGLLIPVHLGITRGAFRIVGSGPVPVGDRWAVDVRPLDQGDPREHRLGERVSNRRVSIPGRNPIRFINGA